MYIRHHPDIEGLSLFGAEPGAHAHEVHAHDAYSVIVVTHGRKRFHHFGQSVIVSAGEIAVANPGEPHGCEPVDGEAWAHRTWYLSPECMRDLACLDGPAALPRLRSPHIVDAPLVVSLNAAHERCFEGDAIDRQTVALEALSHVLDAHRHDDAAAGPDTMPTEQSQQAVRQRIERYLGLMHAATGDQLRLGELAEAGGVHRNQVIRDFRAVFSATPGAYLRHLRLNRAKHALQGGASLADAAQAAGFADQSHFTRCFRAAHGFTPSKYEDLLAASNGLAPL